MTLSVDRHIARVGEAMRVTVALVVSGRSGYERYIPPDFKGFAVSGGGMTTQNIQVSNWKVRRQESHIYTVVPLKPGTVKIGPASVQMAGRRFRSQTVTIKVRPGVVAGTQAPGVSPGPGSSAAPGDPAPDATTPAPGVPADGKPLERVFLAVQAKPDKIYLGQQVLVAWYLYTQSNVMAFHPKTQPTTDKFWSEDLRRPRGFEFKRKVIRNKLFHAAVIARKALFPQQIGALTVGPLVAQVRTMDQFAGAAVDRSSGELKIEVLPLPTQGKPAGFLEQNVGQYDIMANLDRARVQAGEGVTLKLVVRGQGNLRQVKVPVVDALDGFKVYKPKVVERLQADESVSGEKVVEYLLLPTRAGRLTIPAQTLDYFNPVEERYKRVKTERLSLQVTGRMPAAAARSGAAAKNVIGPTIRPPRPPRAVAHQDGGPLHTHPLFLLLLALPLGLVLTLTVGERLRARLRQETPGSQRRAASRRTREHLSRARELHNSDPVAFFAAIAAGLRSLLDQRLGASIEGLTRGELRAQMLAAGFTKELTDRVGRELDTCDAARFAPGGEDERQRSEALDRAAALLDRLARATVRGRR